MGERRVNRETVRLKDAREALERRMLLEALTKNRNNMSQAAKDLGISRPSLYELTKKFGIMKK